MQTNVGPARFWRKLWLNIESSALVIAGDYVRFFMLFAGVAFVHIILRGLAVIGVAAERIKVFEDMDYWATLVALGMFLLNLVIRIALVLLHIVVDLPVRKKRA